MTRRSQRAAALRLIILIVVLLIAMWLVWKVLLDLEPAPPPEVKVGWAGETIASTASQALQRLVSRTAATGPRP